MSPWVFEQMVLNLVPQELSKEWGFKSQTCDGMCMPFTFIQEQCGEEWRIGQG